MDPEDLLKENEEDGLIALPSLPNHFKENEDTLKALLDNSISYKYELQNFTLRFLCLKLNFSFINFFQV